MSGIKTVLRRALQLLRLIPRTQFAVVTVAHNPAPDRLPSRQVVLVGDGCSLKRAYLSCPCGCGDPIMLSLSKTKRPSWRVRTDWLGRPTLDPSVRQTAGCYSHFWVRQGRINWCVDTGRPWRREV